MRSNGIVVEGLAVAAIGAVVLVGIAAAGVLLAAKCMNAWADFLVGK